VVERGQRMPKVTTITVGTNERAWLPECFRSLLASATAAELEILFVDNASDDGSAEMVAAFFPEIRILRNPTNLGFAGANNVGMRWALEHGSDFVFLVNPDTRTPPNVIDDLTKFLTVWPDYGLIGPLQHGYGQEADSPNAWTRMALEAGEAHIFVHTWPYHPSSASPARGRAPGTLEHAYVQGSALFTRAEVLRRTGLFDEAYHTYYEETDLCRRVRWAGWRVALLLDCVIEHYAGGGGLTSRYRRRHMLRNKYYFLATDPDWSMPDVLRLAARWLALDLRRQGPARAATRRAAFTDTLAGVTWLTVQVPRMARRRRQHARLRRFGAGGPLRTRALAAGAERAPR
jgi:GT2 family glycosyltransferase